MLKPDQDTKIVIIGMGYLMEYLAPCYSRLLGANLKANLAATTVDEKDLERKREKFGFPISLGENLKVLEEASPDIILFAPQPVFAPEIARTELKPYFDTLREAGKPLPDLYAFPPNPKGKFYLDTLGDINVVNILPNMFTSIGGRDFPLEGYTIFTFPDEHPWPEENAARLDRFFVPLGTRIRVGPQAVYSALASAVTSRLIYEIVFAVSDAVKTGVQEIASALRFYLEEKNGYVPPAGSTSCSKEGVSPGLYEALKKIAYHWNLGILHSLEESGFDAALAKKIQNINMDLHLHVVQGDPRRLIETNTRHHATRGGVLEKGHIIFTQRIAARLRADFARFPDWTPDAAWAQWLEDEAKNMTDAVAAHGGSLSKSAEKLPCKIEHHAALFALFAKQAISLAADRGRAAVMEGLVLYGRERGGRMAERAREHRVPPTPRAYKIYGEWVSEPGQMRDETWQKSPEYITHVLRCEWCETWKKYDLLEYGKLYCEVVDKNLALGFNPQYNLKITSLLSRGERCCEFYWGFELTEEAEKFIDAKRKEIGLSCVRDFSFHTAHLFSALSRETLRCLGTEQGKEIIDSAFFEFTKIFGREYALSVEESYKL
jgi:hypothetical protein